MDSASGVINTNAKQILEGLLGPASGLRRIRPVQIDGCPAGLCVRVLTSGEALQLELAQEQLDKHMEVCDGAYDQALVEANDAVHVARFWRRHSLRVALAAAFVACDEQGAAIFTVEAAQATGKCPPLPLPAPAPPAQPVDKGGQSGGQSGHDAGAAGVGTQDAAAPVRVAYSTPPVLWQWWPRAWLVEHALPFAVAAALSKGSNTLSKELRDDLGKVSWVLPTSSA